MISAPDFKEKQILFVNADWGKPSKLCFRNDNIVFEQDGKVVSRISAHKTFVVFISGDLSITTNFIKRAKEFGVSIFFLKKNFEMYGGLTATAEGHYVLRSRQYAASEEYQLGIAKLLIRNKVTNQIVVLRERANAVRKKELSIVAEDVFSKIEHTHDHHELLGIEGNISRLYFGEYFANVGWRRRAPRTKEDITNFLMDMGYTFLFNFVDSLLRLHGFDTYKGYYHRLFFQRRSLACDVMEPLRPLVDRQILKMYNLKQVDERDFKIFQGVYSLPYEHHPKYAGIFLECFMNHREGIFEYIHGFYQYIMNSEKYTFPMYRL